MKKILFVCTGNINRSAAAEIMFNSVFSLIGEAKSCGTNKKPGVKISKNMSKVLLENGFNPSNHRSTSISKELLSEADLIVGFQPSHLKEVAKYGYSAINIVDFVEGYSKVPDPHFDSSGETHKLAYAIIATALPAVAAMLDEI